MCYLSIGPGTPKVLVGISLCTVVASSSNIAQTQITCMMPPGNRLDQPVILAQALGELSLATATVSYTQCPTGKSSHECLSSFL
jgi:hypothetical protein